MSSSSLEAQLTQVHKASIATSIQYICTHAETYYEGVRRAAHLAGARPEMFLLRAVFALDLTRVATPRGGAIPLSSLPNANHEAPKLRRAVPQLFTNLEPSFQDTLQRLVSTIDVHRQFVCWITVDGEGLATHDIGRSIHAGAVIDALDHRPTWVGHLGGRTGSGGDNSIPPNQFVTTPDGRVVPNVTGGVNSRQQQQQQQQQQNYYQDPYQQHQQQQYHQNQNQNNNNMMSPQQQQYYQQQQQQKMMPMNNSNGGTPQNVVAAADPSNQQQQYSQMLSAIRRNSSAATPPLTGKEQHSSRETPNSQQAIVGGLNSSTSSKNPASSASRYFNNNNNSSSKSNTNNNNSHDDLTSANNNNHDDSKRAAQIAKAAASKSIPQSLDLDQLDKVDEYLAVSHMCTKASTKCLEHIQTFNLRLDELHHYTSSLQDKFDGSRNVAKDLDQAVELLLQKLQTAEKQMLLLESPKPITQVELKKKEEEEKLMFEKKVMEKAKGEAEKMLIEMKALMKHDSTQTETVKVMTLDDVLRQEEILKKKDKEIEDAKAATATAVAEATAAAAASSSSALLNRSFGNNSMRRGGSTGRQTPDDMMSKLRECPYCDQPGTRFCKNSGRRHETTDERYERRWKHLFRQMSLMSSFVSTARLSKKNTCVSDGGIELVL